MSEPLKLGAIHEITGRQWDLSKPGALAWPDLTIVIPFSCRVIDDSSIIIPYKSPVSSIIQGGYEVKHHLKKIELIDLIRHKIVPDVHGVWAIGPDGDTARLHLLAQDPFSWLLPHPSTIEYASETAPRVVEQRFHYGPKETFTKIRRFNEMLVKPTEYAELLTEFSPALATRVMSCNKFKLTFRTADDISIYIDSLILYIITSNSSDYDESLLADATPLEPIKSIYGALDLIAVEVNILEPIDEFMIESVQPLLVYAVRYREARKYTRSWVKKQLLLPGKYELNIEGTSTASDVSEPDVTKKLPPCKPAHWNLKKEFGITYPEMLRPYIHYSTLGDTRIFLNDSKLWNPTMYGLGFPFYKLYHPVVRFLVPYMSQIFSIDGTTPSKIKMTIIYENGITIKQVLEPSYNSDSATSMHEKSQEWIKEIGGTIQPDQEIVFTKTLKQTGSARVIFSFDSPEGNDVKIDEWSCYISIFDSFKHHLRWYGQCLQSYYDNSGFHGIPCCPLIHMDKDISEVHTLYLSGGNRIDSMSEDMHIVSEKPMENGPLLDIRYPDDESKPYPDELKAPPLDWCLGTELTSLLRSQTTISFARFAQDTNVCFNKGDKLEKLVGINDTVNVTTLEAIVDNDLRPFALWIRTPEPVDWRRVSSSLIIHHVNQKGSCPTGYARRRPLELQVTILPSPDGSSSFLLGSIDGIFTKLPRGEYELTISFDPFIEGMPHLKPTVKVGSIPEIVKMTFIQPLGLDWPHPSTLIEIPTKLVEHLINLYGIKPIELLHIYETLIHPKEKGQLDTTHFLISGENDPGDQTENPPYYSKRGEVF